MHAHAGGGGGDPLSIAWFWNCAKCTYAHAYLSPPSKFVCLGKWKILENTRKYSSVSTRSSKKSRVNSSIAKNVTRVRVTSTSIFTRHSTAPACHRKLICFLLMLATKGHYFVKSRRKHTVITVLSRLKPHGLLTETGIGGSQNMSFRLISQWGFIQNAQWDINRNDQRACGGFLRRVALFLLVPLWTALRMWMARGGSRNLLACLCGFWQYKFICLFIMAELLENTLNLNNHLMLREVTVWENGMLLVQHGARQLILVVSTFLWKCEWYFCVN